MSLQNARLLAWAANTNYAANSSGNLWRDGAHPTKIEPSAADYVEGYANDIDLRAEVMNWMQNGKDTAINDLVLARLAQTQPELVISADPVGASYQNTSIQSWQGSGSANLERMSGAYSRRLRCFVNGLPGDGTKIAYRKPDGDLLSVQTAGTGHTQSFTRGSYVYGTTFAGSSCILVAPGTGYLMAVSDDQGVAPILLGPITGSFTETNPVIAPNNACLALFSNAGILSVLSISISTTGSQTNSQYSTGLATTADGYYQLHKLPSGRIWVTTSRRAAYSDNNGVTWAYDGALAGSSQGESVVYDQSNARWLRFSLGVSTPTIRVAADPNNPTSATVLKNMGTLFVFYSEVISWGRFFFTNGLIIGDGTAPQRIAPCVSSDGLTWVECGSHYKNQNTTEGAIGRPLLAVTAQTRISATPHGICARGCKGAGPNLLEHVVLTVPIADIASETAFT